jgi:hypothetical protein
MGLNWEALYEDGCSCPSLEIALSLLQRGGMALCDSVLQFHDMELIGQQEACKVGELQA